MRLEYLREFITVAHTLNFSEAAKRLCISQPALSLHIQALEKELGVELFHRNHQRVALSQAGLVFLNDAAEIVSKYDDALNKLRLLLRDASTSLSIGYLFYAFKKTLPFVVASFKNTHPSVETRIQSYSYEDIMNALETGEIDIALTIDIDDSAHNSCRVVQLEKDFLRCVVRKDDPLARASSVSLKNLQHEAFILPDPQRNKGLALYYDSLFRKAGIRPIVASYYADTDSRTLDVESGNGISLLGHHLCSALDESIVAIPIIDDFCYYNIVALWKKDNRNLTIEPFIDILVANYSNAAV